MTLFLQPDLETHLGYYHDILQAHHHEDSIVIVEDLRLCTIRIADDVERRFCFEVISPSKSFLLQAESEDVRQAWIQAIQVCNIFKNNPNALGLQWLY